MSSLKCCERCELIRRAYCEFLVKFRKADLALYGDTEKSTEDDVKNMEKERNEQLMILLTGLSIAYPMKAIK